MRASTPCLVHTDHADDSCVEYSQIMTYCCGTQGKVECEAAGHAYSGPDEPCEVLKVNVIAGPLSCTGLINASGLLESCVCPGGERSACLGQEQGHALGIRAL